MKSEKLKNIKRRWLLVLIIYGIFVCLFFAGKYILKSHGMEYREYAASIGFIITWTVPWICGLAAIIRMNRRKMIRDELVGWSAAGAAVLVIYIIVMLFLSGIVGGFGLMNLRTEEKEGDIIIVRVPHFMRETETYYCDPVGPFARKEFTWDGEREKKLLEQEYGMNFMAAEDEYGNRSYIPEEYPQLQITIENPVPLKDDFPVKLAAWYFENTYENQDLKTEKTSEGVSGSRDIFCLKVSDESELKSCAEDAALLIGTACEDAFFDEHAGWLTCILENGGYTHTVTFYFGAYEPFVSEGKQPDYYSDSVAVLSQLSKEWQSFQEEVLEWSGVTEYDQEMELPEEETRIVSAAKCLYEELKGSMDGFEETYNAKGNLCINIEMSGTDHDTVQRSIVFDRMSKNERCYLFALYEGEQMVDFYAVNITTKEVTASGKHSYADTGSKAYQEAAGEP